MKPRIVQCIEVAIGPVRHYFTAEGERIGMLGGEPQAEIVDAPPPEPDDMPRRPAGWTPPPFDPRVPGVPGVARGGE